MNNVEGLQERLSICINTSSSIQGYNSKTDVHFHSDLLSSKILSPEDYKCKIYMMDLSSNTIKHIFQGFGTFEMGCDDWTKKCCYVFDLQVKCYTSDVKPTIWLRGSTETKSVIFIKERLDTERSVIVDGHAKSLSFMKFMNIWNHPCKMLHYPVNSNFCYLEKQYERDIYHKYFNHLYHTESDISKIDCLLDMQPFEVMNDGEIGELYNPFRPWISLAENQKALTDLPSSQTISNADLKSSRYLYKYFIDKKLCDITVHVQDQIIRAHKVALANGSKVWRDLFFENEKLTSVQVVDFDYGTIKTLIEYIYTGIVNQQAATDQLLMAAEKYTVSCLKKHCETFLSETIALKTSANLLVLAYKYNATTLFSKVVDYIGQNRSEFQKLDEAKSIFMSYPELAFELFANI